MQRSYDWWYGKSTGQRNAGLFSKMCRMARKMQSNQKNRLLLAKNDCTPICAFLRCHPPVHLHPVSEYLVQSLVVSA